MYTITHDIYIIAIEKRLTSPLLEPASVQKVMEIDTHIGAAVSGLDLFTYEPIHSLIYSLLI